MDKKPTKKRLTKKELEALLVSSNKSLDEISQANNLDKYEMKKAQMFALSADGFVRLLEQYSDVYEALDKVGQKHTLNDEELGLVCVTCGWASPTFGDNAGNDIPPSQHPQRRRVRLVCLGTKTGQMASVVSFQDDEEEVIDYGQAKGSLADAVKDAVAKMMCKTN